MGSCLSKCRSASRDGGGANRPQRLSQNAGDQAEHEQETLTNTAQLEEGETKGDNSIEGDTIVQEKNDSRLATDEATAERSTAKNPIDLRSTVTELSLESDPAVEQLEKASESVAQSEERPGSASESRSSDPPTLAELAQEAGDGFKEEKLFAASPVVKRDSATATTSSSSSSSSSRSSSRSSNGASGHASARDGSGQASPAEPAAEAGGSIPLLIVTHHNEAVAGADGDGEPTTAGADTETLEDAESDKNLSQETAKEGEGTNETSDNADDGDAISDSASVEEEDSTRPDSSSPAAAISDSNVVRFSSAEEGDIEIVDESSAADEDGTGLQESNVPDGDLEEMQEEYAAVAGDN